MYTTKQRSRFWAKVAKVTDDECWVWTACYQTKEGYGRIKIDYVDRLAHRVSWEIHRGPIPDGLEVCHTCDNPPCVNPAHLFLGTHSDNIKDMHNKKRHRITKRKMTLEKAREMRRLAAEGWDVPRLCAHFGVVKSTVSYVLAGKTWKEPECE